MDLSNFQRRAIIFLFAAILLGSILLARKQPLIIDKKTTINPSARKENSVPGDKKESLPAITKININTATAMELTAIPGIGPKTAQIIIDFREQKGGFSNLAELLSITGIGPKKYERIKQYVYLNQPVLAKQEPLPGANPQPKLSHQYNLKATCPHCGRQLWEEGTKKRLYVRCPHCLELIDE